MAELNVTELDFDTIKANLKAYLKNQTEFQDYDFEGSGLSVLLDILAYNTHYMAVYGNMLHNELFLDSATTRNAIVSRAKELGYTPRSSRAARAKLHVVFTHPGNPNPATIERGTKFTTEVDGVSYIFVTNDSYSVIPVAGVYTADIDVYQGQFVTQEYTVDVLNPDNRFIVSNTNVDSTFISVTVKFNANAVTSDIYTKADTVVDLDETSKVYFLQVNEEGKYEISFGDGVVGDAVETGNIVGLEYLVTSGSIANGASQFSKVTNVAGATAVTITTIDPASGGSEPESLSSIKLLAPKLYQTQERVVTEDDYRAILLRDFTNIDTVSVWGGEENDPPYYGKVFICINPKEDIVFSNVVKEQIKNDILNNYNIMAIRPEIVDPSYLYIIIDCDVNYNFRKTSLSAGQIETLINDTIVNFFATELNTFNATLYYSKLVSAIDAIGDYMISNTTKIKLQLRPIIPVGTTSQYILKFSNVIYPGSLSSDEFTIDGINYKLRDLPTPPGPHTVGTIQVYRTIGDNVVIQNTNAGSIDYTTGKIILSDFGFDAYVNTMRDYLSVTVELGNKSVVDVDNDTLDITTNGREQLLALSSDEFTINVTGLKLA